MGLVERAEALGPGAGRGQRRLGERGELCGFGPLRRRVVRGHVMGGHRPGQLLVAERDEVPRSRDMAVAAIAQGEGRVGHLPDQRLHEGVLPALRRSGVHLDVEQVGADKALEPCREVGVVRSFYRGQRIRRERLAEHGRVLDQCPVHRVEGVEAGRDQGMQRVGDRQLAELADPHEAPRGARDEAALGHEHPDGLHRVQGNSVGAGDDRVDGSVGQARRQPGQQRLHRGGVERLEVRARGRRACRGPSPAAGRASSGRGSVMIRIGTLRLHSSRCSMKSRGAPIGPLEVLEQQRDRPRGGQPLEERAPRAEQLRLTPVGRLACAEQGEQGGLDPPALDARRGRARQPPRRSVPGSSPHRRY